MGRPRASLLFIRICYDSVMQYHFPDNFLWGAGTSAHQIEGGTHNQWTEWEKSNAKRLAKEARKKWEPWQQEKFPEMFTSQNYISGRASDHYHRFEEDFDIAQSLNHNAHRLSIEWSRIEPKEGWFDEKEIEHYRNVFKALRERGIQPIVALWHWTTPLWLQKKGGEASRHFPHSLRDTHSEWPRNSMISWNFGLRSMNQPQLLAWLTEVGNGRHKKEILFWP